tara:strand:+ start:10519 stop:10704 length:186 start_codon:yes stop_codon:yes gene_type:complete
MDLKEIIYSLERENPNNMDLGAAVRTLINNMKQTQSQEIAKEQLTGQLDLFNHDTALWKLI